VAQAVQTWRGLPTCEQQAVLELKEEDQRRKRMERRKQVSRARVWHIVLVSMRSKNPTWHDCWMV
jgi:hypothetical protein